MRRAAPPAPSGFTLLELLAVLALLAMAAAIAWPVPRAGGGSGAALRRAGAAVVRQLSLARAGAERDGQVRCVQPAAAAAPCLAIDLPAGVEASQPEAIRFHGDGSSNGGTVTLSAAGRSRTIEVVAATGRIVQR